MKATRLASAVLAAAAITISSAAAAPAQSGDRTTASALFEDLLALRSQAEAIVQHPRAPRTLRMEREFRLRLERYQTRADHLSDIVEPVAEDDPAGDLYAIASSLAGVDELLYNAVYEGTSHCDRRQSNLDFEVVDAYVAHLRRLFAGELDQHWQPPQVFAGSASEAASCS